MALVNLRSAYPNRIEQMSNDPLDVVSRTRRRSEETSVSMYDDDPGWLASLEEDPEDLDYEEMPSNARKSTGQFRGRSRKKSSSRRKTTSGVIRIPVNTMDEDQEPPSATTPTIKPREERPFKEFFPDLNIEAPLAILSDNIENSRSKSPSEFEISRSKSPSFFGQLSDMVTDVVRKSLGRDSDSESTYDHRISSKVISDGPFCGPVLHLKNDSSNLPKVSCEKISKDSQIVYKNSLNMKSIPGRYLRYSEPVEDELFDRVEYDMDEQDNCWLSALNALRSKDDLTPVSEDVFELIMDQLEKLWFHLTKDTLTATQEPISPEQCVCSICGDGETEASDAIIFCDGCNVAVHQDCYGVPFIPEGPWLCRKCMVSPQSPVSCIFCPNEGGAFKQTTTNQWAHLLCALWIPEVSIINPVYAEPIDGIERIPKSRWKLVCGLCKKRVGACIQCHKPTCFAAFHVTCARNAGLYMKMKHYTQDGQEYTIHKAYCRKHTPSHHQSSRNFAGGGVDENFSANSNSVESSMTSMWEDEDPKDRETVKKTAQAHKHGYLVPAPVAPQYILDEILAKLDVERIFLRQRLKFVSMVCKYWSLKRQARRGAPFLKRLHLEPWTAYSTAVKESEAIRIERFKALSKLRKELELIRILAELGRKREKEKLKGLRTQYDLVKLAVCPLHVTLSSALSAAEKLDKKLIFAEPVSSVDVPDYYDIIKNPMDFSTMRKKLNEFEYESPEAFEEDLRLICSNCLIYNKPDTIYARYAIKLQKSIPDIIDKAKESLRNVPVDPKTGVCKSGLPREIFEYPSLPDPLILSNPPEKIDRHKKQI